MSPSFWQSYNSKFTAEKYQTFLKRLDEQCGTAGKFRVCETPCFFATHLPPTKAELGKELVGQLVENPAYHASSDESIPPPFRVPNEAPHPMFAQVDFGLIRAADGELQPKL